MIDVKLWLPENEIDATAWAQIGAVTSHPFAAKHLAIMPDCHGGYGVPIGSVFVTKGAVIPNAVGVDIGCGMVIEPFTGTFVDNESAWKAFAEAVRETVPMGNGPKGSHSSGYDGNTHFIQSDFTNEFYDRYGKDIHDLYKMQMGTLGGGNHFLEVLRDEHDNVYFMVHSGSRGLGAKVAEYYHRKAQEQSKGMARDLAALTKDTPEYDEYLKIHDRLLTYANRSRLKMLHAMRTAYSQTIKVYEAKKNIDWTMIHMSHNYASRDYISGNVIHRKGASQAKNKELTVIPGSMGTKTYIVRGKGSIESHESCSHGSGRVMGRQAAKRDLNMDDFRDVMKTTFTHAREGHIDESPLVYKDVDQVIARQSDLVDIERVLFPVITIKA